MSVQTKGEWEEKQAHHFDKITARYEAHYSDKYSQRYRFKFFNEPMLEGIDLTGMHVLEAMCGSGQTTDYLLSRGARVTGLDISSGLIASFKKKWPRCDSVCASIFDTQIKDNAFDCVVVVGGLHHLQPQVHQAVDEIHRVLKPGGYFCFAEPHAGSLPDLARKLWYRHDVLFEKNERAIDIDDLRTENASRFDFLRTRYLGNIAYLLVLNSLIFRIPLQLKRVYAPVVMAIESAASPFLTRRLSCFVVCQWRKKQAYLGPASASTSGEDGPNKQREPAQ
jgi:ubiquinone/menaquinone biosynthesis C-methylase UbiE